ncbi:MAG TPA: hypothetical protein PKV84_01445 [Candidatus Omnitrophota bacterium]|nr:hypothetical protein [Candidatus Omnitrophota bacterium]
MGDHEISRTGQETKTTRLGKRVKLQKVEVLISFEPEHSNEKESNDIKEKSHEGFDSLRDFIYQWALEVAINERQKNSGCLLPGIDRNSAREGND